MIQIKKTLTAKNGKDVIKGIWQSANLYKAKDVTDAVEIMATLQPVTEYRVRTAHNTMAIIPAEDVASCRMEFREKPKGE